MNNYIPLILTAIVTISTIIYTFYSIQLWRTTRAAAEISRQAAFGNLWAELNRYLEMLRQQEAPEAAFLQKVSNLLLEYVIADLMINLESKPA
jgi:cytochrome c oxidase assembly factor CtaG